MAKAIATPTIRLMIRDVIENGSSLITPKIS
jgi:hypothetical protein